MDNILMNLKLKFNYDDSLLELLKLIIPNMIIYFGEENKDIIINAFINTPIKIVKDRLDGENFIRSISVKDRYSFPTYASGLYDEKFQENENGKIERIAYVLLRNNDLTDERLSVIVHELCHMVMNYNKAYIKGNYIYSKVGLNECVYEIVDGIGVQIKDEDVPLEEGMNEYDARRITELILGHTYESTAYQLYYNYVSVLMDDENTRKVINDSRLKGDNTWKNVLGEELSAKYKKALNDFHNLIFNSSSKEELLEKKEILYNTKNEVSEYIENISNKRRR